MYKLNEEKMFFDMEEEQAIVIDSELGVYYAMNTLASHVFEKLIKGASIQMLADALKKIPDCPQDIHIRIEAFVASLVACEMLLEDSGNNYEEAIEANQMWFIDGDELIVESYGDMVDLILADPVHDVDAEYGWPVLKEEDFSLPETNEE